VFDVLEKDADYFISSFENHRLICLTAAVSLPKLVDREQGGREDRGFRGGSINVSGGSGGGSGGGRSSWSNRDSHNNYSSNNVNYSFNRESSFQKLKGKGGISFSGK
jgi:hypothetical protein